MNERMHESLSALLDGEADELEIRRLLNQTERDEQLFDKWANYQMIGAIMRQEAITEIDLAKGVRQALDGKPMDELNLEFTENKAQHGGVWRKLTASGAIAASVMVAVLVGVQWQQADLDNTPAPVLAAATTAVETSSKETSASPALAMAAPVELTADQQQELEQAQRRLQEYVLRHNGQEARDAVQPMLPFMQTVRFQKDAEARRK